MLGPRGSEESDNFKLWRFSKMETRRYLLISFFFFSSFFEAFPLLAQDIDQDTLPDNYLLFNLHQLEDRLEGENEYLEGFVVSMDLHREFLREKLEIDRLVSFVRDHEVIGTLTYPNGKTSQIKYEVVRHRETDDVYMKTTLGYFLWEHATIHDEKLKFVINWWYCPPARQLDLETLEMAGKLLGDPNHWHKSDDRRCEDDLENHQWSLFCALKHASIEKMGEYNHHNTAMQTVRFAIDSLIPGHGFEHTLMDFNNSPSTKHGDVIHVLRISEERIERELEEIETNGKGGNK
jgi:hypothetical protein